MTPSPSGLLNDGFLCWYDGCDFDGAIYGCVSSCDCLCIRYSDCCAMGVPSRGCGITTDKSNNEIVKCGFLFAECGIIRPYAICNMARKIFSCFCVGSLPCNEEYVSQTTLGIFCLQCYPEFGCCLSSPECKALDDLIGTKGPTAMIMGR